jgi:hypothetical protein
MLERLSANDFSELPDRKLATSIGEEEIVLEIAEVRQLAPTRARSTPPFSIVLRERAAQRLLPQGVYAYRHPQHGTLHLFTVPIGRDADGMLYEVILN